MAIDWYWILGLIFIFFGVGGNSWVIFIIVRRRRLQKTTNWFILSLAVADLGVTCGNFPAAMICNVFVDTCNKDVRLIFAEFFTDASAFCLTAMVIERYIAIVHSLKYVPFLTNTRTVIIITSCWTIPFLFVVSELIIHLASSAQSITKTTILLVIFAMLFKVLPTILVFGAQFHILLIARRLSHEMKALFKQIRFNVSKDSVKTMVVRNVELNASTVWLVTVLVIIFLACCGVGMHTYICFYFNLCNVDTYEKVAYSLFLMVNSSLNPLVYAFLKEDIERESKAFLCRKRHENIRPFQVHTE